MPVLVSTAAFGRLVMTDGRRIGLLVHKPTPEGLAYLTELFEAGDVAPLIDSSYALADAAEAFRRFGEGHVRGKLVITP